MKKTSFKQSMSNYELRPHRKILVLKFTARRNLFSKQSDHLFFGLYRNVRFPNFNYRKETFIKKRSSLKPSGHFRPGTGALSLVYSTAEYCALAECCSVHTHLINSVLYDALGIVVGRLHLTPTDHLPVLSSIQQAEFCD